MIPVVIPAYQRPQSISSIIKKSVTNKIYISLDYPNIEHAMRNRLIKTYYENYAEIKDLVTEAKQNIKDKEIILLEHSNKNLGIVHHFFKYMDIIFKIEDKVLILDDDIIPSEAFFYYANTSFNKDIIFSGFSENFATTFNGRFTKKKISKWWGVSMHREFYNEFKEFYLLLKDDSMYESYFKKFCSLLTDSDINTLNSFDKNWKLSSRKNGYLDYYLTMFAALYNYKILVPCVSLVSPSLQDTFAYRGSDLCFYKNYQEVIHYEKEVKIYD